MNTRTTGRGFDSGKAARIVRDRVKASPAYVAALEKAREIATAEWKTLPTIPERVNAGGRTGVATRAIDNALAMIDGVNEEMGSQMFPTTPASILRAEVFSVASALLG